MRNLPSLGITALFVVGPLAAQAAIVPRTATPSAVPAGWAATSTRAIVPLHAVDLGRIPGGTPLHIVVGLRMRDRAGADALLRRQHMRGDVLYHHILTPAEFAGRFNATGTQVDAVARYLDSHGFSNVQAPPNNLLVSATAPA
ncbi:MAG: hypothetical protein JO043_12120, partial [Candidatus Eremiobacteraeota bacterium]|nr:hypothetical protein [Candidatus Eremiobacteraeota bacterium]